MRKIIDEFRNQYSAIWAKEYCQLEKNDCGPCCLAYLATRLNGNRISLSQFKEKISYQGSALNLNEMVSAGKSLNLSISPLKFDGSIDFYEIDYPAIFHLNSNHYIVVYPSLRRDFFNVFDPEKGVYRLRSNEIQEVASGYFLEVSAKVSADSGSGLGALKLDEIYEEFISHKRTIACLIFISFISQAISLAPMVLTQHIIDEIHKPNAAPQILILLGFSALILFFDFLTTNLRGGVLNRLRVALSLDSAAGAMERLWSMSAQKITTKSCSLLIKDFESAHILRDILCNELVAFILNVSTIIVSAILLFYYLPIAAMVSIIGATIYVIIKLLSVSRFIFLESEAHIANSNLTAHIYETLDQISSIKSHPLQNHRKMSLWDVYHKKIENEDRQNSFSLKFTLVSIFVFGFISIVSYAICFSSVILTEISLGFAFAFIALQQRFISACSQCIDGIHTLSMFRICLDRLSSFRSADQPENFSPSGETPCPDFKVSILDYPLSGHRKISGTISSGKTIIVQGKSGSGKSTFLRSFSRSFYENSDFFKVEFEEKINTNMTPVSCMIGQGDRLLSGTIEENITFFSKRIDYQMLNKCIEVCGLSDLIKKLEYGIKTRLTLASAPFSGGEYQRVLLARALYSKPDILIIDEATSDLDLASELEILDRLKHYVKTLIIVSHKSEIQKISGISMLIE